jgi:hypothetical protein
LARVTYKGFNLPDGNEVPNVPSDLTILVDGMDAYCHGRTGIARGNVDAPQNSVWGEVSGTRVTVTTTVQRLLKITGFASVSVITATVTSPNLGLYWVTAPPFNPGNLVLRLLGAGMAPPVPVSTGWFANGSEWVLQPAGTRSYALVANGGGTTGTIRVSVGITTVEDYGPSVGPA